MHADTSPRLPAAFLDADEYIVLRDAGSLPELLQRYEGFGGLHLHWRFFAASGHVLRPHGGVLRSYTACCGLRQGTAFKSIVQLRHVKTMLSPHQFSYKRGKFGVNVLRQPTRIGGSPPKVRTGLLFLGVTARRRGMESMVPCCHGFWCLCTSGPAWLFPLPTICNSSYALTGPASCPSPCNDTTAALSHKASWGLLSKVIDIYHGGSVNPTAALLSRLHPLLRKEKQRPSFDMQATFLSAVLNHYFTRSLTDFEAKQRRGSGIGGRKELSYFLWAHRLCNRTCTDAVPLGEALYRRYNVTKNVPDMCFRPPQLT